MITLSSVSRKSFCRYERKGDSIAEKITISREQAKIIATAVVPNIKTYIESHRAEYEAWLKEEKAKEVITTQQKTIKAKGA